MLKIVTFENGHTIEIDEYEADSVSGYVIVPQMGTMGIIVPVVAVNNDSEFWSLTPCCFTTKKTTKIAYGDICDPRSFDVEYLTCGECGEGIPTYYETVFNPFTVISKANK